MALERHWNPPGCACHNNAGLGDLWSDIKSGFSSAGQAAGTALGTELDRQTLELQRSIKVILALSAIAAITGVISLVRGK